MIRTPGWTSRRETLAGLVLAAAATPALARQSGVSPELPAQAKAALDKLLESNPGARKIYGQAAAVLVFPKITKAGLLVGGATGDGVLYARDQPGGYYRWTAASYGLQIGEETYSYALFFMTDEALAYLQKTDGWEVGTGPTLVVADETYAKEVSTMNLDKGVYVFIYGQKGLMAGGGVQGAKITKIQ
ncbi:lipid-binding SYLF domain-containing protein [Caulobacter sp. 17J65-9]|uniref:lipid-binding SYLF domain-containing protein n=1 Tax=Caulobacter sp. 17J65-9 TaxID=2709382 RepID=UPI0013C5642C|nr:lipid-binding SYLF domain-containing protein [Caulobacter sp. 17J65-9]NEX93672.1 lipid-binding SYLF domain-containing protein [Caulobacter sp. 17J65-9]